MQTLTTGTTLRRRPDHMPFPQFTSLMPTSLKSLAKSALYPQRAKRLAARLSQAGSIDAKVEIARAAGAFRSNQKKGEITPLLDALSKLEPRRILEIGSDRGGTLALFAHIATPPAKVLSIDINYPSLRAKCNKLVIPDTCDLTCLECDSHSAQAFEHASKWLNGERLDFLFIDGDHSYDGVKADYETFSPLVRPGGLIGFHDIVEDYKTRYGRPTLCDVGEVPRYWRELKSQVAEPIELIEDPEQDGYGIGLVKCP